MNDDKPTQRTLKIGKATVGLIGLDIALNRLRQDREIGEEEAVEELFAAVARQNYIPPGTEGLYREALLRELKRLRGEAVASGSGLTIRILGPGCVSCNNLNTLVIEAMQRMGVAADIDHVHELDEIWRYGVTKTPALVINEEVKSAGRLPSPAEVEMWLREAAGRR